MLAWTLASVREESGATSWAEAGEEAGSRCGGFSLVLAWIRLLPALLRRPPGLREVIGGRLEEFDAARSEEAAMADAARGTALLRILEGATSSRGGCEERREEGESELEVTLEGVADGESDC